MERNTTEISRRGKGKSISRTDRLTEIQALREGSSTKIPTSEIQAFREVF